jgi:hypothetical protein
VAWPREALPEIVESGNQAPRSGPPYEPTLSAPRDCRGRKRQEFLCVTRADAKRRSPCQWTEDPCEPVSALEGAAASKHQPHAACSAKWSDEPVNPSDLVPADLKCWDSG